MKLHVLSSLSDWFCFGQQKRAFTNMAGFSLVCLSCQTPLKGQNEALQHAKSTGHTNFDEVR
jgi:ubiquitin thioesterase OTU1